MIPTYIPGESAYSWVSQYFVHSAYSDRNHFCNQLFHCPAVRLHPALPGHIEAAAQAAGVDPQYLLHHGSAFPLFALTLNNKHQVHALAAAMLGEGRGIMALSGQAASKLSKLRVGGACLKWCPACLLEDEKQFGVGIGIRYTSCMGSRPVPSMSYDCKPWRPVREVLIGDC
ncbi:TniQ family protein [Aeromonas sp. R7-2]|uniref:TniQ family protein n=1 Tax=Aeromonas sp. R7-2 TaxID=3138474 RepID=UPI0034A44FD1